MLIVKKVRCFGGEDGSIYANYHDYEWGVVLHDDTRLFEMLVLEGAQAGLSWETVLKKREEYRNVFFKFDIEKVASMSELDLERLLTNTKIIRNRLKILSVKQNALVARDIQKEFGSLDSFLWSFVNYKPIKNNYKNSKDVPSKTKESIAMSISLKKRGMKFVGPTIMYAFMQAVGMVNDHLVSCTESTN